MEKFQVIQDRKFGRVAVLVKNVRTGEIVVDESPFVIGPKQNSSVICLECYCPVNMKNGQSKCTKCGWPLCNACQTNILNHNQECNVFANKKVVFHAENYTSSLLECPQLDCITPLRNRQYQQKWFSLLPDLLFSRALQFSVLFENIIMVDLYSIRQNDVLGRYLVCNNEISSGQVILDELPYVLGPKISSPIICLGCYVPVQYKQVGSSCPQCKWPLCKNCIGSTNSHLHKTECEIFSKSNVQFQGLDNINGCVQLDCITPLRMLLKMESDTERWDRDVAPMEHHDEPRRAATDIWNADLVNVAKYLRGPCKLSRFSEELIMKVIGILEVNAFEARTSMGYPFRGLYPLAGILAHSCIPNSIRTIYPSDGFRLKLRAMIDLKSGEQLNHSYTYTLNGTAARLQHLRTGKYFTCQCKRCADPTELGTHFSSLKCIQCDRGLVCTTNPFDAEAEWKCSDCNAASPADNIENTLNILQSEIDDAQAMELGADRLETTEELYRKYSSILHPMHYMQTGLRQSLIEMYGRVKGYELPALPNDLLQRKVELCRQVLQLLDIFEPGLSRYRSIILYEIHVPIVLLAKAEIVAGLITAEEFKSRLLTAINALDECYSILKNEDQLSHEGSLAVISKQAKEQLENSIETI